MIQDKEDPARQWDRDQSAQYDSAVEALMRDDPNLSRSAASRRINALLEIADQNGRKALGHAAWRGQSGGFNVAHISG